MTILNFPDWYDFATNDFIAAIRRGIRVDLAHLDRELTSQFEETFKVAWEKRFEKKPFSALSSLSDGYWAVDKLSIPETIKEGFWNPVWVDEVRNHSGSEVVVQVKGGMVVSSFNFNLWEKFHLEFVNGWWVKGYDLSGLCVWLGDIINPKRILKVLKVLESPPSLDIPQFIIMMEWLDK